MSEREIVAVTCNQAVDDRSFVEELLNAEGYDASFTSSGQQLAGTELIAALAKAVGVLAGDEQLTADVLEQLPQLRAISRWGIGLDNVDLVAAERLGIPVTNTPGVFADTVAEVALGYTLAVIRGLVLIDRSAQAGEWKKYRGRSLRALTVGVIGLGSIGQAFAEMVRPLARAAVGFDVAEQFGQSVCRNIEIPFRDLTTLLGQSDIVVICASLSPETTGLMNARRFGEIKQGAVLVNVGRGPIVREADLVAALDSGHLAAAALDVFEVEPLPAGSALRGRYNVVLGCHNSSNSDDACFKTHEQAVANLVRNLK